MSEHDSFLKRLEETLSRISAWVAERGRGSEGAESLGGRGRIQALLREVADARRGIREAGRADLERVRASVEDLSRDYDAPPPRTAFTHAELAAFRRHLHTTARLLRDISNLDSPNWSEANEEYERSWDEVERARSEGPSASP